AEVNQGTPDNDHELSDQPAETSGHRRLTGASYIPAKSEFEEITADTLLGSHFVRTWARRAGSNAGSWDGSRDASAGNLGANAGRPYKPTGGPTAAGWICHCGVRLADAAGSVEAPSLPSTSKDDTSARFPPDAGRVGA